jgi:hypothetical protein
MKFTLAPIALAALLVLLASCGSSDKSATDPEALLKKVQESQLGGAYNAYVFFADRKWTPLSDPQRGALVKFDGLYDLNKIKQESCAQMVTAKGAESVKDLENIAQMTHSVLFGVKDGAVDIGFSGWAFICANGVQKSVPDPGLNTQKEIMSNSWQTDCETLLQIARKGCEQ